ncbi:MAG: hypothetical protein JST91_29925 [Actinobacteria bacterium]|nr:hypothetical protein [Actinomycetota bacterium]
MTEGSDGAGGDVVLGSGTVFSGCNQTLAEGDDLEFSQGQVFVPSLGRNVRRPVPAIPAGQLVINGACTVAGDENVLRVVYVFTVRTPSSGLNPESTETRLVTYDPNQPDTPVASTVWPADSNVVDFEHIVPTQWGFMAHGRGGIMGFDLTTLHPTWRSADTDVEANRQGYVTFDTRGEGVDDFEWRYRFHSAKDGAEVASSIGPSMPGGIDVFRDGFGVEKGKHHDGAYEYYYFDMRDTQFKGPIPTGGAFWGDTYTAYSFGQASFIAVWDMDKNEKIFSREGADVAGLNIEDLFFAGKYLYIANDSDSPVINITTGDKVSSNWQVRPTEVINRDWMLVVKGHVTNEYFNCFHEEGVYGCYEDGTLVYAPNGQYDGPWF